MQGQCNVKPLVTFPVAEHHLSLDGTKLYCEAHLSHICTCEQLAQSGCLVIKRLGAGAAIT